MKRSTRNVLVGYGAFCAVNWAATYYAARSGSPVLLGSAGLLTLNESLRPLNILARLVDPIAAAEKHAAPAAVTPPGYVIPEHLGLTDQAFNANTWN